MFVRDGIQSSWMADTTWILRSLPETNVGGTPKAWLNDRVRCAESKNPAVKRLQGQTSPSVKPKGKVHPANSQAATRNLAAP